MKLESQSIRESIYSGAVYGIIAWSAYAVVECFFSSILPWLIRPAYDYKALHTGFTALLFLIYAIIGMLLGGVLGLGFRLAVRKVQFLQKIEPTILFQCVATLTVVLAFDVNLVVHFQPSMTNYKPLLPLFISLLPAFILVLSGWSNTLFKRLSFLANPWAISIILVGLPWLILDRLLYSSRIVKIVTALSYPAVIFIIAFLVLKVLESRRQGNSRTAFPVSPIKSLSVPLLLMFITLGTSSFFKQTPLQIPQNLISTLPGSDIPNVVLITMDTVRADHLSLYGYERDTTPYLKKFSKEATLYTRATATASWTLPSHASIFTGMYSRRHGAHTTLKFPVGKPLSEKFLTLPEILSKRGYFTAGVVSNYGYLFPKFGLNQGFYYYDYSSPVPFLDRTKRYFIRQAIRNFIINFTSLPKFDMYRNAKEINSEVFSLFEKIQKDKRFFLFINYMDAHWPYIPPFPFDEMYPGKDEKFDDVYYRNLVRDVMKLERKVTEKERRHMISQYDGGIAYVDFQIGKLISRLKELGLYENSLIIITSDHGEVFGRRDLMEHGGSVYQDMVYIPLLIKYPNIKKGYVVDKLVSLVDLMPTILDLLRYKIPEDLDGQSLLNLEFGKHRNVISESFVSKLIRFHSRFNRVESAIFSGPYKLISSTAGKRELYDLTKDPNEEENIYNEDDIISREIETKLNRWLKTTVPIEPSDEVTLDKDTLDRLKALGYIQ